MLPSCHPDSTNNTLSMDRFRLMKRDLFEYLPAATKLGQGNVFTGVCDSVHWGGLPQCMLGYHIRPPSRPPQSRHTPPSRPPQSRHPQSRHPPPGVDTPREADAIIRLMSGRYVSSWNAFLFMLRKRNKKKFINRCNRVSYHNKSVNDDDKTLLEGNAVLYIKLKI